MSNLFFDDGRPIDKADVLLDTAISMIGMDDTLYAVKQKEDVLIRVIDKTAKDMAMRN